VQPCKKLECDPKLLLPSQEPFAESVQKRSNSPARGLIILSIARVECSAQAADLDPEIQPSGSQRHQKNDFFFIPATKMKMHMAGKE